MFTLWAAAPAAAGGMAVCNIRSGNSSSWQKFLRQAKFGEIWTKTWFLTIQIWGIPEENFAFGQFSTRCWGNLTCYCYWLVLLAVRGPWSPKLLYISIFKSLLTPWKYHYQPGHPQNPLATFCFGHDPKPFQHNKNANGASKASKMAIIPWAQWGFPYDFYGMFMANAGETLGIRSIFSPAQRLKGLLAKVGALHHCLGWQRMNIRWCILCIYIYITYVRIYSDQNYRKRSYQHFSIQWEFQDPKMEVLYHIKPYFVGIFPYIGLI